MEGAWIGTRPTTAGAPYPPDDKPGNTRMYFPLGAAPLVSWTVSSEDWPPSEDQVNEQVDPIPNAASVTEAGGGFTHAEPAFVTSTPNNCSQGNTPDWPAASVGPLNCIVIENKSSLTIAESVTDADTVWSNTITWT